MSTEQEVATRQFPWVSVVVVVVGSPRTESSGLSYSGTASLSACKSTCGRHLVPFAKASLPAETEIGTEKKRRGDNLTSSSAPIDISIDVVKCKTSLLCVAGYDDNAAAFSFLEKLECATMRPATCSSHHYTSHSSYSSNLMLHSFALGAEVSGVSTNSIIDSSMSFAGRVRYFEYTACKRARISAKARLLEGQTDQYRLPDKPNEGNAYYFPMQLRAP